MTKKHEWEVIDGRGQCGDTCRMKVENGYLYRERECADRNGITTSVSLAFAPNQLVSIYPDMTRWVRKVHEEHLSQTKGQAERLVQILEDSARAK